MFRNWKHRGPRQTGIVVVVPLIILLGVSTSFTKWHADHLTEVDCTTCNVSQQKDTALIGIDCLGSESPGGHTGIVSDPTSVFTTVRIQRSAPRAPPNPTV